MDKPKYINPFVDFSFKLIFGQKSSGEFLIHFLNSLLKGTKGFEPIESVKYLDKEQPKEHAEGRAIIYDILCTTEAGKQFIVEMQNQSQALFIDRSLFYVSRAICNQAIANKSKWDYQLMPVHFVAFLNFTMEKLGPKVITHAMLSDVDTNEPITEKERFTYIQLPHFKLSKEECQEEIDEWLYTLKNMNTMEQMPFTSSIFGRLATAVEYASLDPMQRIEYDRELKAYRDRINQDDYIREKALAEGRAEGRAEERAALIRNLFSSGMDLGTISRLTKIAVEEVKRLLS